MVNLKKIFNSLDLRNNKIINLKVEQPTQDEHPVNKEYLDNELTYSTGKSILYQIPFNFPWTGNINGLKYKELLDNLLFPKIEYIYKNPIIKNIKINNLQLTNEYPYKFDNYLNPEIKYDFNLIIEFETFGDRIFKSFDIINNLGFDINNIDIIENIININILNYSFNQNIPTNYSKNKNDLILIFENISTPLNNTYNQPTPIPTEFQNDYRIEYDILNLLIDKFTLADYCLINPDTNKPINFGIFEYLNTGNNFFKLSFKIDFIEESEVNYLTNKKINVKIAYIEDFDASYFKNIIYSEDFLITNLEVDEFDTSLFTLNLGYWNVDTRKLYYIIQLID